MRRDKLAWCIAFVASVLSCSDGTTDGQASTCAAGLELCNGQCVTIGGCTTVVPTGCQTGYEFCNNVCVVTGTCQTTACPTGQSLCAGQCVATGTCGTNTGACATGQVLCNNACVTGSSCPIAAAGGATSTSSPGTTAAKGGTVGTGGTTAVAKGGSVATTTGPWVDPNPSVCNDTSLFIMNATAQYKKSGFPLSNNPTKTYIATTNWWHAYTNQAVAFNGLSYTVTGASSTSDNYPAGYPAFYIGSYQQTNSQGSGLPKLVSSLTTVPVVLDTNVASIDNSNLNASFDVWFNTSADPLGETATDPTGGFLMVWYNKPSNRQPRGSVVASGQTIGSVSGSWDVWSDGKCVSYVRTSPINALTFDLNDFIKNAVSNNRVIKSNWYLAVIFGGFEIWNGGNGAKVNKFCAKVN